MAYTFSMSRAGPCQSRDSAAGVIRALAMLPLLRVGRRHRANAFSDLGPLGAVLGVDGGLRLQLLPEREAALERLAGDATHGAVVGHLLGEAALSAVLQGQELLHAQLARVLRAERLEDPDGAPARLQRGREPVEAHEQVADRGPGLGDVLARLERARGSVGARLIERQGPALMGERFFQVSPGRRQLAP